MLKFVCLFALFAVLALPTEATVLDNKLMLMVRPLLLQCAVDNGVSESDLQLIINNQQNNDIPGIACMSLCFLNKLGMFEMDGTINVQITKELFSLGADEHFVDTVVDHCKDLKGADACGTAAAVYACYVQSGLL